MFHTDHEYPLSANEVLSPPMRFKAGTLSAMKRFKKAKPWSGTQDERTEKFRALINDLTTVYGIRTPYLDATGMGL